MIDTRLYANPDHALVHRFMAAPGTPLVVDTSPIARAMQVHILKADTLGNVELSFEPNAMFVQGAGVLQGGALVAMLDFAMAFAAMTGLDPHQGCATISLNTSFLRAAPQGTYIGQGHIERRGRSMVFTQARLLRASDGEPVASASSALAITSAARS